MHYSNYTAYMHANPNYANSDCRSGIITAAITATTSSYCNGGSNQDSNPEADRASGDVANGIRFANCDSHRVANDDYSDASSQPHERACHSER